MSFVHLATHSEYSLVDSVVRIKPLVKAAVAAGMPAIAITDHCNLFALVKFYRAALDAGVKPIAGADIQLLSDEAPDDPSAATRVVFLCQNDTGYQNLTKLISLAYREGQITGSPYVQRRWLAEHSEGLLALLPYDSDLGEILTRGHTNEANECIKGWSALFPERLYFALSRTSRQGEENYIHACAPLALEHDIPLLAVNDVRFIESAQFESHEARTCIRDGRTLNDQRRPKRFTPEQYLRSPQEMAEQFADLPEAVENTLAIAQRCNLNLRLGENFLPDFPIPEGMTTAEFLCAESEKGLEERLAVILDPTADDFTQKRNDYYERLKIELDVINGMGFPGYFLIVADFIQWSKDNDIPVGPGRGSGAGSLVAYALKITDLDPLQYDLLFERFLNPERVSMPDFDVDFCMEGRDRVIEYVANTYGRDAVSQIITYGTMAAKAVVRDVGRVLGHPYGFVDRVAKMVPFEVGMTLTKAFEESEELATAYEEDEEIRYLLDLALSLEGLARNTGKHAGGVVIAPGVVTDFSAVYVEQGSDQLVTQFDKDDVEAVGLVKFDFLGLRTLTIIDWALQSINGEKEKLGLDKIEIESIPLDDEDVYKLLQRADTTAVFQLESAGMKKLIKNLRPDNFEDIIALVALYRPGPLGSGMVDDFCNVKKGMQAAAYPHPLLEPVLKTTYGVILYQEQVMLAAQVLAGYSLGGADLLRRAMGKKKPEVMAEQRNIFRDGCLSNNIDNATADSIFDLIEKFAGYGFNKSHSAAYALVSYQTAWLKCHYPAAFMAAVLSSDMDNTDKVVGFIDDCGSSNLDVLPPDVNTSKYHFKPVSETEIRYGLGAIKGVGEAAIEGIVAERENGEYKDIYDFCRRVDLKKTNRRTLETLIKSGALDTLGENRATLVKQLPEAVGLAEQAAQAATAGQADLFGLETVDTAPDTPQNVISVAAWPKQERLQYEKETLGLYLTGHPLDDYMDELQHFTTGRLADLKAIAEAEIGEDRFKSKNVVAAGLLFDMRIKGSKFASITMDDGSHRFEAMLRERELAEFRHLLQKDAILILEGKLSYDDFSGGHRLSVYGVRDLNEARTAYVKNIVLEWQPEVGANSVVSDLKTALTPHQDGICPIYLNYRGLSAMADLRLGDDWKVSPTDELLRRLRMLFGRDNVTINYKSAGEIAAANERARDDKPRYFATA